MAYMKPIFVMDVNMAAEHLTLFIAPPDHQDWGVHQWMQRCVSLLTLQHSGMVGSQVDQMQVHTCI